MNMNNMNNMNNINNINKIPILYINLERRTDRKIHIEKELKKLGIKKYERFNAIDMENGALGCTKSHIKCIELAIERNYDYVIIMEDDIEFLNPSLFLNKLNKFLDSINDWDVLLISGNNMLPFNFINDSCIKVYNCQTTTGYIVRKEYYKTLLDNYNEGLEKLLIEPNNEAYKIDKYWMKLQKKDKWYLLIPPSVVQREDYSDIEKKITNYKNYMLNINKLVK